MDTITVAIVVTVSLGFLGFGIWLGSRMRAIALETARTEGRAESSIEVARLQERAAFHEQAAQKLQEHSGALERELRGAQAKSLTAETEGARLRERLSSVPQIQEALAKAEATAATATQCLVGQREEASRLRTQVEAAAAAADKLQQRTRELTSLEEALRSQLGDRDRSLTEQRELVGRLGAELEGAVTAGSELKAHAMMLDKERCDLQAEVSTLKSLTTELQTTLNGERAKAQEKLDLLLGAREDLLTQFKALSSDIMEEKGRKFTEQNAAALGHLLDPVKDKLIAFQAKIDEVYRTEGQERTALGEQLKQLVRLNQTLSEDAQNLTRALKGDQKTQGTWGEIVLDTVLEQAGLIEGTHFERQSSFEGEEQKRSIPDVVIRLPGDRQLVVDSKVSLTAYERAASATSPEEREVCVKQHVTSLRNHIRSLSEKNYQQLYQLKSLDFVLLFVPLEPAFATAVSHDNQIFREAWDRNVILVSPSTLLFVVRTVAYLWRQETQARNVIEIAKRGAALYDKLCGFVEDLDDVGKHIQRTGKAYDAALRKLAVGDGNVIRQAEMLRDLGVKPTKQLPIQLVDRAMSKVQHSLLKEDDGTTKDEEVSAGSAIVS